MNYGLRGATFRMRFLSVAVMLSALTVTFVMHRLSWAAGESGLEVLQRDDFSTLNRKAWKISGDSVGCSDGILSLRTAGGPRNGIRITSVEQFRFATAEMRVRFSRFGKGANFYLGFMSRAPQHAAHSAWLLGRQTDSFILIVGKNRVNSKVRSVRTPRLKPNQWYTVRIEWTPVAITLAVDGKPMGSITDPNTIPTTAVPLIFDAWSADKEITMEVDQIVVRGKRVRAKATGEKVGKRSGTPLPERIALPIRPKRRDKPLPQKLPEIALVNGHAVLENGFLKCSLSLDNGPMITGLENKFISQNIIDGQSRLFLVHHGAELIGSDRFKRVSASVEKTGTASILHAVWRCSDVPLDLDMRIRIDSSPEMSWQATIRNTGLKEEVFRVTCPILEHIRIGDQVRDDIYFYPHESGICGGLDYEFRHAYGFTLSMQIMNVFDPAVGGGVYTFAKDDTGYPKILLLRKMSVAGKAPPAYSAIPYLGQDPGRLFDNQAGTAMAIRHIEYQLAPGQSARLPEIAVGVHEGDWHGPLRRYSRWAHTWFRKVLPTPKWYMDTYSYLSGHRVRGLHLLSQKKDTPGYWDTTRNEFSYSRQMGLAEENSLMEWAYWWRYDKVEGRYLGMVEAAARKIPDITLRQYGDYDYDSDLGGLEALRKEIARIHDKKGRLLLYTHYDACWQGTRIGKAHGKEWARMDRPGQYSTRYLRPNEGWKMCPYISGWRDYFSPLIARRVQETGADGCRLDTGAFMYACHNLDHDHYDGTVRSSLSPKRMGQFLLACQKTVRAVNPEAIVTTEHAGSDYLTQFTDGYFSQNLVWVGNPATNKFRSLNQYRIVFTRFYFPEVKTAIHGAQPWSEAVTMGLFNACAPVCMRREGVFRFDAVRENGDAFNSLLEPEPLVDTLVDGLYANYFPGSNKRVWTFYNRTGQRLDCPLIQVPAFQGVHYVEVYNDLPVKTVAVGQDMCLSAPVKNEDVICIAQLPEILVAKLKGKAIEVDATRGNARGCTLEVAYDTDIPSARTAVPLNVGRATITLPEPLPTKAILKLMKGYYLIDEIVLFLKPVTK